MTTQSPVCQSQTVFLSIRSNSSARGVLMWWCRIRSPTPSGFELQIHTRKLSTVLTTIQARWRLSTLSWLFTALLPTICIAHIMHMHIFSLLRVHQRNPFYWVGPNNFMCSEDLCKLGQKYFNVLICKFYTFSRQNSDTSDISHTFLLLTIAKLSTLKNSPFFGPLCIFLTILELVNHDTYSTWINCIQ